MILISGGAGVMGSRLVRGLVERGRKVRVLDRPGTRIEGVDDVDLRHGDISKPETLEGLFDGVETVYHLAAELIAQDAGVFQRVNVEGTRNMVEGAAAAGVKHFVFISSASVVYPHTTPYSLSKRECERIVKSQQKMHYTIVRPTLAYNEHGGEEFRMFLDYLKKYPAVPFIGRGHALKRPVHVDDLMNGFLAIEGRTRAYGKTYGFSGGEDVTIWELAQLMLKHQGISKPFLPLPVWFCKIAAAICEATTKKPPLTWNVIAGITQNANLDHAEATADLGYQPIGIREGLQRCWPLPANG